MIPHSALSVFLQSMQGQLGFSSGDVLLAVTTLSFDIAGLESFLPLAHLRRVASRAGEPESRPPTARTGSGRRLQRGDISFLQATPASWRLLLESGWAGAPDLTMLCGGEALPRALADRLLDKGKAIWNLYGPTETTIWSSAARVEAGDGRCRSGAPDLEDAAPRAR